MREMKDILRIQVFRSVQFFAEAIIHLRSGATAFIEADGLEVLSNVHAEDPTLFVYVGTTESPGTIWSDAVKFLSEDQGAVGHRLLADIRRTAHLSSVLWPGGRDTLLPFQIDDIVPNAVPSGKKPSDVCDCVICCSIQEMKLTVSKLFTREYKLVSVGGEHESYEISCYILDIDFYAGGGKSRLTFEFIHGDFKFVDNYEPSIEGSSSKTICTHFT
jgi:hypothetical protein